jgi:hypothetical protein
VRYRIQKGVVLFVSADLADKKYRVQYQPVNYQREKDDPMTSRTTSRVFSKIQPTFKATPTRKGRSRARQRKWLFYAAAYLNCECRTVNIKTKPGNPCRSAKVTLDGFLDPQNRA